MTELLIRLFIKNPAETERPSVREAYGVMAGCVCIACNILLAAVKFAIGLLSGSIAIQADAVNNLSDVGSSAVMVFGAKAANKPADREHPYGHARIEYVVSLGIAFLILLVGFSLGKESVMKIITPEPVEYSLAMFAVLAISILVKLWMGRFTANIGKRINSGSMSAASADSIADVMSTGAILVTSLIGYFFRINIDGYVGVAVALFVLYSGIGIIKDTIGPLIGEAPDPALIKEIDSMILSYPGIIGTHDLLVHSYGPGKLIATAHAEVRSDSEIMSIHETLDRAEREIGERLGLLLTLHLDPLEVNDERVLHTQEMIAGIIKKVGPDLHFHDFRMVSGEHATNLVFDVVVPPGTGEAESTRIKEEISAQARAIDESYRCVIDIDINYGGF